MLLQRFMKSVYRTLAGERGVDQLHKYWSQSAVAACEHRLHLGPMRRIGFDSDVVPGQRPLEPVLASPERAGRRHRKAFERGVSFRHEGCCIHGDIASEEVSC